MRDQSCKQDLVPREYNWEAGVHRHWSRICVRRPYDYNDEATSGAPSYSYSNVQQHTVPVPRNSRYRACEIWCARAFSALAKHVGSVATVCEEDGNWRMHEHAI